MWCVNNENTTLITRRNGKVVFMGNCTGNAIDFTCEGKTAEEVREIIKAKPLLLPCKVRLEEDVTWVHIDVYDDGTEDKITTFKA
ncbi:MAG: Peptidase M15 [Bacteriophage sp.]|nr:MAG: Peptidase M15 [Bacteriophage sp.]